MRKLMMLGISMAVMLAACDSGNGLEGNTYELDMDGMLSGTYEFGGDVIEGEIVSVTLEGDDVPDEVLADREQMNAQLEGLPYTLTKVKGEKE